MGEETASSPTTAITTRGGARTRASTAEAAAGSPTSPQEKGRRSVETTSSGPLHTPNYVTSPSPPPASTSTSTSAIPFSWEEHPGVPKATSIKPPSLLPSNQPADSFSPTAKLPLPPPLRPSRPTDLVLGRIKKRPGARGAGDRRHADPFAVALVTCSRGTTDNDDNSQLDDGEIKGGVAGQCEKGAGAGAVPVQAPSAGTGKLVGYSWRRGSSWRWGAVVGDRFGMGSCMPGAAATGAVMDSTVRVPRRPLPAPTTVPPAACPLVGHPETKPR